MSACPTWTTSNNLTVAQDSDIKCPIGSTAVVAFDPTASGTNSTVQAAVACVSNQQVVNLGTVMTQMYNNMVPNGTTLPEGGCIYTVTGPLPTGIINAYGYNGPR